MQRTHDDEKMMASISSHVLKMCHVSDIVFLDTIRTDCLFEDIG
jgi:hypothetical protein